MTETTEEDIQDQPWIVRFLYHVGKAGEAAKEGVPEMVDAIEQQAQALSAWAKFVYENLTGNPAENEPLPGEESTPDPAP